MIRYIRSNVGTPDEFMKELKNRIDELNPSDLMQSKITHIDDATRRADDLKKYGFYETDSGRYDYHIDDQYVAGYYADDEYGGFIYDMYNDKDIVRNLSWPELKAEIRKYRKQNVTSARILASEVSPNDEYIDSIMPQVDKSLQDAVDLDIKYQLLDEVIEMEFSIGGTTYVLDVPYDDLTWDKNEDVEYIADGILDAFKK